ncbi:MAG: arginine repressor [Actinobacteria bacterium]|jgi:transcriptional regulator of arginine metabolism|nr:arginine repressor [Actinomycetota bacterium]
MVNSAAARRAKVIALVESGVIHSQSDLVKELKKSGYKVTQATASRDLEEIGAVRGSNGYQLASSSDDSLARVLTTENLILSVEASGNLAVVRTPPGGAQLLASNLDHSRLKSIIGTIAGDDTVLVVSRKSNGGAELAKELLALGKKRGKK